MAYADKATNFDAAFDELKISLDHSLPGRPQTNSIAERTNQFVIGTTTTCLLEAGLPPCFWRTAIECACHLLNVEPGDDGLSAWCHMRGKEFQGNMIPYGAKVYFKPSGAREVEQDHKFDPKAIPGIFAGYNLGSGNHWQHQYKVWELADFAKQNFAYDAMKPERSLLKPHITEKVVMVEPIEFPLKREYERMNGTLEGMKDKERLDGSSMYIEDQKDGDDDDDEDGDDGDGGDMKKLKSKGQTRTDFTAKNESEERVERIMEEMDKGYYP